MNLIGFRGKSFPKKKLHMQKPTFVSTDISYSHSDDVNMGRIFFFFNAETNLA